ncbi:MAG: N-acetylglucosamine-6-phosphate deacetylase [Clostridia bacterium]|nr:N-acetylglucosamine-6-phosphate deacetylase [Clostridia bacterium]
MKAFENALVYLDGEGIKKCDLAFGETIQGMGKLHGEEVIPLPEGAIVLPGFIDEHVHGAGGSDAMDGSSEALSTIAATLAEEGTTGFLATTMTQSPENITAALSAVRDFHKHQGDKGARLLGAHLEGPFIAAAHKGAQPLEYVAKPSVSQFDKYNAACGNLIKIVTLAPEEEGAEELVTHLSGLGIVPSIGHTGAKFKDIERAIKCGAKHITHTYNAQSPLHHREIGTVGSALLLDELSCELICDTIHVSVPAMKLLVKCKNKDKLILITDAIRAKGLSDGVSELGGQTVYVKNGEARLADGTLAGSVLRMNRAVQNLVEKVGVSLTDAVDCASKNPAKSLGIFNETGSIAKGKRADFAVLSPAFDVIMTVRGGLIVYKR